MRNKIVVVTGGTNGIGLETARALAKAGADVHIVGRSQERIDAAVTSIKASTGSELVHGWKADLASHASIRELAPRLGSALPRIDVLINNAGVVRGNKYFWETDLEHDTKATIDINTLGPMYVAHEFLPAMIAESGECRMLNLASAAGFTPNPRMAVYAASKWAVIGWSDSVRLELKQAGLDHVKVTTVCPYYVRTGMFDGARSAPLLPILDPADVVNEAWAAMLAGRPFVVLPKTVMLSEMLKGVVPTGVRDFIADHVIGVYHTMEDFTGRAGTDTRR